MASQLLLFYTIPILSVSNYPRAETPFPEDTVTVKNIPHMAARTIFAASENESKPTMRCVKLVFTSDGLKAVSYDGSRLAAAKGDSKGEASASLLIPAASLNRSFYRVLQKGQSAGKLNSWPLCGKCCIQRDCKLPPIRAYMRSLGSGVVQYIGIAYDEQERLTRLEAEKTISLLEKYQKTERDAADICKRAGLYSPAYAFSDRNGCFFCPNAKERELRHLYECYPDLWARLLECQGAPNKATELFNRKERFDEIDQRFRNEDAQMSLFDDRPFRAAA